MNPAIAEIVLVVKTLKAPHIQVAEPYVFGVDARHPATVTIDLVSTATNFKAIEMYVLPTESDLKDFVEVSQRALATHQQAAPNQRANRSQHRPELIDSSGSFRAIRELTLVRRITTPPVSGYSPNHRDILRRRDVVTGRELPFRANESELALDRGFVGDT